MDSASSPRYHNSWPQHSATSLLSSFVLHPGYTITLSCAHFWASYGLWLSLHVGKLLFYHARIKTHVSLYPIIFQISLAVICTCFRNDTRGSCAIVKDPLKLMSSCDWKSCLMLSKNSSAPSKAWAVHEFLSYSPSLWTWCTSSLSDNRSSSSSSSKKSMSMPLAAFFFLWWVGFSSSDVSDESGTLFLLLPACFGVAASFLALSEAHWVHLIFLSHLWQWLQVFHQ